MMNIILLDVLTEQPGILFRDGKVNTVIAVLLIIFTGVCIFLFLLNRKVSRLEKKADALGKADQQNPKTKS